MGQNPRVLKSGVHDQSFYKTMWDTVMGGRVWQGELVNKRKDGSLYTEEMTITPVFDRAGNISHFIAIKQDVTERQRAQEALRQSEQRVRLKLESILSPEGEIGNLDLADIIDVPKIQSLMDEFHKLVGIPMAIIDSRGWVGSAGRKFAPNSTECIRKPASMFGERPSTDSRHRSRGIQALQMQE